MMLITMDGCYMIDRQFQFRRVQMRFPCRQSNDGLAEKAHHFTLLDGEMVIDTLPDSQMKEKRYPIYDMMAINSVSVTERPFHERWKMIEKEVIEPRNHEQQHIYQSRNPYYRYDLEPFRVRRKDFWLLSTVIKLLKEFIPKLSHEADVLIFQGWDDTYVPGTHKALLKWKYASMYSVDFLVELTDDGQFLYLHEHGKKRLMEGTVVFRGSDPSLVKLLSTPGIPKSGCGYACESGQIKEPQKSITPIGRYIANLLGSLHLPLSAVDCKLVGSSGHGKQVMKIITDDDLLGEINEIICLPMYADRIRNDGKASARGR